jgi:hypothetical protein
MAGAPCISASDPTQLCGGGPIGPLPSFEAPPSDAPTASAAPASSAPIASPPAAPPAAPPAGSTGATVVTAADNDATLHLSVGERFTLALGTGSQWTVKVADPAIVAPVTGATLAPGEQGMFVARARGTTILDAVGAPLCQPGAVCPMYRLAFAVTIEVD